MNRMALIRVVMDAGVEENRARRMVDRFIRVMRDMKMLRLGSNDEMLLNREGAELLLVMKLVEKGE
jgi:hypothetical protein